MGYVNIKSARMIVCAGVLSALSACASPPTPVPSQRVVMATTEDGTLVVELSCVQRLWSDTESELGSEVHVEGVARGTRSGALIGCAFSLKTFRDPPGEKDRFTRGWSGLEFDEDLPPFDQTAFPELTVSILVDEVTSARHFEFERLPKQSDMEFSAPPYTVAVSESEGACVVSIVADRRLTSERSVRVPEGVFGMHWLFLNLDLRDRHGRRLVFSEGGIINQYGHASYRLEAGDNDKPVEFPVSLRFSIPDEASFRRTRVTFRNVPIAPANPRNLGITRRSAKSSEQAPSLE